MDKSLGREIADKRKEFELTQGQLANLLGVSETHLWRIEQGKQKVTKKVQKKIDKIFAFYESDEPLQILFDYVRLRFETTEHLRVISEVLGINPEYMYHEPKGFYGYPEKMVFGDIVVFFSVTDKKLGVLLELKGKGCRLFETFLQQQGITWFDFFRKATGEGAIVKRLDIAVDDRIGILDIRKLADKRKRDEGKFKSRKYDVYICGGEQRSEHDKQMGYTLYLGSRRSNIYFCLYEKDYEQFVQTGLEPEFAEVKNRCEIRLKDERAENAMKYLLEPEINIEAVAFDIIYEYVTFLDPKRNVDKQEWQINPMWSLFISGERRRIKLTTRPEAITLKRQLKWIDKQVAPTLKMISDYEEQVGTMELEDIMENTHLSTKHRKHLEQLLAPLSEVSKCP